jgi:tetratricopeptide (TPR) repeat protein
LGLVAFELLSGESPESARDVMTHGDLPPLGRVTASMQTALRTIIVRALAKDPKDRFDSATSFGIALSRITEQPENTRDAKSAPQAPTNTEPTVRQQPTPMRWLRWLIASPFIFALFLILVSQLPRGDLRDWHPFSPDVDSTEENETKNRITPEKRPTADKAPLVVLPFENLTGDESWNGLSRSAHASIRDALRATPEITLVDHDVDSATSEAFRVRGSVQRAGIDLRLVVHVEAVDVVDEALRGEPIDIAIDSNEMTSLTTLRRQTLDETKLLVRHWRSRQRATLGTKNDQARAKLLQYHAMVGPAPKRQHVEAGMALLNEALALDSAYLPALVERAYLQTVGGPGTFAARVAQSIVDLDTAKKLAPDDPDAAVMRCRVMQVATVAGAPATDEQIQHAREACQKALQLAPSSAFVLIALARLSDLVCQDDEAIRLLEQSIDLDRGLRGRAMKHLIEFSLLHGQINVADRMSGALLSWQARRRKMGAARVQPSRGSIAH